MQTLDKAVGAWMKVFTIILAIPLIIILVINQTFVGATATSISPIDPTRTPGFVDYFGGQAHGSGTHILNPVSNPSADGCFEFVDATGTKNGNRLTSWPSAVREIMDTDSIPEMKKYVGGYMKRLCEKGTIKLYFSDSGDGYCGKVYDADSIIFFDLAPDGSGCTYTKNPYYTAYLFAHETGHVYYNRLGYEVVDGLTFGSVTAFPDAGTLTTYPGDNRCTNHILTGEDYADTIGNWVHINTVDCPNSPKDWSDFWDTRFPNHKKYAVDVLTRP